MLGNCPKEDIKTQPNSNLFLKGTPPRRSQVTGGAIPPPTKNSLPAALAGGRRRRQTARGGGRGGAKAGDQPQPSLFTSPSLFLSIFKREQPFLRRDAIRLPAFEAPARRLQPGSGRLQPGSALSSPDLPPPSVFRSSPVGELGGPLSNSGPQRWQLEHDSPLTRSGLLQP